MESDKTLDMEYIQNALAVGYNYAEKAEDKNVVLALGNTGEGKSTTICYLAGQQMKEEILEDGTRAVTTVDKPICDIGHTGESHTLYAMPVLLDSASSADFNDFVVVDCPGISGNRSTAEEVVESVSMELVVRKAKQVKGVMIVISMDTLNMSKVAGLKELVKTLVSLFNDPIEMVKYSIFLITKKYMYMPDVEARERALGGMKRLKKYCTNQAAKYATNPKLKSAEKLGCDDYETIAIYLTAVLENKDNIVFVNPLDDGESRTLIWNKINCIKPRKGLIETATDVVKNIIYVGNEEKVRPINIDDFAFNKLSAHRNSFYDSVYHLANDGYKLMARVCKEAKDIEKFIVDIADAEGRLVQLQDAVLVMEEDLNLADRRRQKDETCEDSIVAWKSLICANNQWIESIKPSIAEIVSERENLVNELSSLDNSDPWLFRWDDINYTAWWFRPFSWRELKFSANTKDKSIPIIKVDKSVPINGKWIDEFDRRHSGYYSVTYESDFYQPRPVRAKVETFIKTKDDKGNRLRIQQINKRLDVLRKQQDPLDERVKLLMSNNLNLEGNIKKAESDTKEYKDLLNRELKKGRDDIEYYSNEIPRMKEAIQNAKISGLKNLDTFFDDQKKYQVIVDINYILHFPSSLVMQFVSFYNSFLIELDVFMSCFNEEGTLDLSSNLKTGPVNKDRVYGLKDPITGREIKDLVVTLDGTPFDEHSLLSQFDLRGSGTPPPFFFKHPNGTLEEIKYLVGWNKMSRQQSQIYYSPTSKVPETVYCKSEMNSLSLPELEAERDKILQEIESSNKKLDMKKIYLEKVYLEINRLQLDAKINDSL